MYECRLLSNNRRSNTVIFVVWTVFPQILSRAFIEARASELRCQITMGNRLATFIRRGLDIQNQHR